MNNTHKCLDCGMQGKQELFGPLARCPNCNSWRIVDSEAWHQFALKDDLFPKKSKTLQAA